MSNKEPVIGLHPLNDCVLVELKQSRQNVTIKEGKYDSRTEGIVIRVHDANKAMRFNPEGKADIIAGELIGKRVHFEEYKEGARIKRNGKMYSFIKIEDIRGYEDE